MIDLSRITYRVAVMDGGGNQYNITDYIQNLGWEENENELSLRLAVVVHHFSVRGVRALISSPRDSPVVQHSQDRRFCPGTRRIIAVVLAFLQPVQLIVAGTFQAERDSAGE